MFKQIQNAKARVHFLVDGRHRFELGKLFFEHFSNPIAG